MKFTNHTFLDYYLKDLTGIDTTHSGKRKSSHPNAWNIPQAFGSYHPIDLLDATQRVWIWSDQHFGHKNIIQYSNRPYPNVELMNECLWGNYRKIVQPDDIVIWGGDIAFGNIQGVNEILNDLPGHNIHIIGNHDMSRNGKINGLILDEQYPCLVLDVDDAELEYQILLTHHPLTDVPDGCINIHGHCHQSPQLSDKHINVCVEHTNYAPISMKELTNKAAQVMRMYS